MEFYAQNLLIVNTMPKLNFIISILRKHTLKKVLIFFLTNDVFQQHKDAKYIFKSLKPLVCTLIVGLKHKHECNSNWTFCTKKY